jgi:hypothetical protein
MTTTQTSFTADELLVSHEVEKPLVAGGVRCHGGFDGDGRYVSPRTKNRAPAIRSWQEQHRELFGGELLDIGLDAWPPAWPNVAQAKFLLSHGVRQPIITELTRIGTVEGFGALIRFTPMPEWRKCVEESLEGTATAHLASGLYEAHARDEAGFDAEGGHQQMWYAARDVAFENPVSEDQTALMLERIGLAKPGKGSGGLDVEAIAKEFEARRLYPDLAWELEMLIDRMIRLMLIEISAFHIFAWAEELLADPALVAGEGEAARLVSYIRSDETPHVEYLKTSLTELRDRTFIGESGRKVAGREVVGRMWERGVDESLNLRRRSALVASLAEVTHAVGGRSDSGGRAAVGDFMEEFHSLGDIRPDESGEWPALVRKVAS